MEQYNQLSRAQLSFDYLHTNSTTHEFLFGAVAELIDNARDAGATELDIYTIKDSTVRGNFFMCFADNGCGMTSEEVKNVIIFGKSLKKSEESSAIGMYGNGLKSGSMRIGNDMILFTKKDGIYTCLFLSRSFHEEEKLDEIIVPLPSFRGSEKAPIVETPEDKKRHDLEMHLILKYSPFRCQKDFFAQFDKLKGNSGTVVVVYNMKLLDNGSPELDITTAPRDVILASNPDHEDTVEPDAELMLPPERRSLRAYISILYSDPRMKVYLQGRKVQTKRLLATLHSTRKYNFASKTFRTRAEADLAKAKEDVRIAELRAKEADSKALDSELRFQGSEDPEHLRQIRRLRNTAAEVRSMVAVRQNTVARKQKSIRDPKTLTFYFGVNVMNRACDGMFVYNCSRLIKMYQRIGPQQDSSMMCRGVVGIVDVPYMVLEPTHNKQDFADAKEYRQLMRAMADHLMQYWDDLGIDKEPDSLARFWKSFGYLSARWRDAPSSEDKYARRRCCSVSICVQCDKCLKWRVLPFSQSLVGRDLPDTWQCRDNPDHKHKRCEDPEEDMSPPIGVLKRKIKTKEQRQAELEKQIRKKQEELELIQDPDDENETGHSSQARSSRSQPITSASTKTTVSPRKRNSSQPAIPVAQQPASKRPTVSPSTPSKSRLATAAAISNGPVGSPRRTGLPLPSTNQRQPKSGGLVPKTSIRRPLNDPKNRRSRQHEGSSEDEDEEGTSEEEEEEEEEDEEEEEEEVEKNKKKPVETSGKVKQSAARSVTRPGGGQEGGASGKPDKLTVNPAAPADKSVNGQHADLSNKQAAQATSSACQPVAENSSRKRSGGVGGAAAETTTTTASLANSEAHRGAAGESREKASSELTPPGHVATEISAVNKRIHEKFRSCLQYFLPPEWPMQKDQIHTLTESELSNFPLQSFFDRYEQGLRSLLATFQHETKVSVDRLSEVRANVAKLLKRCNPDLANVSMDGEEIDTYLTDYLSNL